MSEISDLLITYAALDAALTNHASTIQAAQNALEQSETALAVNKKQLDTLRQENSQLRAEIERLKAPTSGDPLIWADDFSSSGTLNASNYAIDGVIDKTIGINPEDRVLWTQLAYHSPLNEKGKAKAELGPRHGEKAKRYGRIPWRTTRWFAISMGISEAWKRSGHKTSVIQWHGSEDEEEKGTDRNANIGIHIFSKEIVGWRLWNDKKIQKSNENRLEMFRFPYKPGDTMRFIAQISFDWRPGPESAGVTNFWLQRPGAEPEALFREVGPNAYNDDEPPYFCWGIYVPSWNADERDSYPEDSATPRTLWWRDLRIGGPGATLADML